MGKGSELIFFKRRHTNGQQEHEKMFNITNHQGNAKMTSQNHNEINPLSVVSFANVFSHSEGCLFVLFMVSFTVQKPLRLIKSHLFYLFLFLLL